MSQRVTCRERMRGPNFGHASPPQTEAMTGCQMYPVASLPSDVSRCARHWQLLGIPAFVPTFSAIRVVGSRFARDMQMSHMAEPGKKRDRTQNGGKFFFSSSSWSSLFLLGSMKGDIPEAMYGQCAGGTIEGFLSWWENGGGLLWSFERFLKIFL